MTIPQEQEQLWLKIRDFELDDTDSEYAFSDRLAHENRWPLEYALHAIEEYKKFIFLICISTHPLTPSDQVDQVWHLHLLYTRSYWIDLCKNTLRKEIHHGPTKGGSSEKKKFTDYYTQTKKLYQKIFGHVPPETIWPENEKRFNEIHFQRINTRRHWIIKKLIWK